jgi:hypothetical protein
MIIRTAAATDDADHRRHMADIERLAGQVGWLSEAMKIALEHLQNDDLRRARLTLENALNRNFE